jgi:hypothetical protein
MLVQIRSDAFVVDKEKIDVTPWNTYRFQVRTHHTWWWWL